MKLLLVIFLISQAVLCLTLTDLIYGTCLTVAVVGFTGLAAVPYNTLKG
jgi:hypothetical protein